LGFIDDIEGRSADLRQAILAHPFIAGVGDGTLPVDKFKHYVSQDYVFLVDYSRVLAIAAARAPDLETMSWFAGLLDETLNTEMALHRGYCAEFGISTEELTTTRPAPTTLAYTSFLLKTANQGSFRELTASLLPCQWGYWEIGQQLSGAGVPPGAPLYAKWVEMYASAEFHGLASHLRDLTGRLGDEAGPTERAAMEEAYRTNLRLEYRFWDMAYNLEDWVV
jgi:thiaminase/transcriptional activator TenA